MPRAAGGCLLRQTRWPEDPWPKPERRGGWRAGWQRRGGRQYGRSTAGPRVSATLGRRHKASFHGARTAGGTCRRDHASGTASGPCAGRKGLPQGSGQRHYFGPTHSARAASQRGESGNTPGGCTPSPCRGSSWVCAVPSADSGSDRGDASEESDTSCCGGTGARAAASRAAAEVEAARGAAPTAMQAAGGNRPPEEECQSWLPIADLLPPLPLPRLALAALHPEHPKRHLRKPRQQHRHVVPFGSRRQDVTHGSPPCPVPQPGLEEEAGPEAGMAADVDEAARAIAKAPAAARLAASHPGLEEEAGSEAGRRPGQDASGLANPQIHLPSRLHPGEGSPAAGGAAGSSGPAEAVRGRGADEARAAALQQAPDRTLARNVEVGTGLGSSKTKRGASGSNDSESNHEFFR